MANYSGRQLNVSKKSIEFEQEYYNNVGFANRMITDIGQDYYSGPAWFSENAKY